MVAAISCLVGDKKDGDLALNRHIEVRGIKYFCQCRFLTVVLLHCFLSWGIFLLFDDGGKMVFCFSDTSLFFVWWQWFDISEMVTCRVFETLDLWDKTMVSIVKKSSS